MEPEGVKPSEYPTGGLAAARSSRKAATAFASGAPRRRASLDFLPSYGGGALVLPSGEGRAVVSPLTTTGLKDTGSGTVDPPLVDCPGFPQSGFLAAPFQRQERQPGVVGRQQLSTSAASTLLPVSNNAASRPPRRASLTHTSSSLLNNHQYRALMRGVGATTTSNRSASAHGAPVAAVTAAPIMSRRVRSFDESYGRRDYNAVSVGTASPATRRVHGATLQGSGVSRQQQQQQQQQLPPPPTPHVPSSPPRRRIMHRRGSADYSSTTGSRPVSLSLHASPRPTGTLRQGSRSLAQRRHSASVRSANAAAAAAASLASSPAAPGERGHLFTAVFQEDTTTATPTSLKDYEWGVTGGADSHADGDDDDGGSAEEFAGDDGGGETHLPSPWEDDPFLPESPMQARRPRLRLSNAASAAAASAAAAATTLNTRSSTMAPLQGIAIPSQDAIVKRVGSAVERENGFVAEFDIDPWDNADGDVPQAMASATALIAVIKPPVRRPGDGQTPSSLTPSSFLPPPPTTSTMTQGRLNRFRRASSFQPGTRVERNSRRSHSASRSAPMCNFATGVANSEGGAVVSLLPVCSQAETIRAPSPASVASPSPIAPWTYCPKTPKTPRHGRTASSSPASAPVASSLVSPVRSGVVLTSPTAPSPAAAADSSQRSWGNEGTRARSISFTPDRSVLRSVTPQNVPIIRAAANAFLDPPHPWEDNEGGQTPFETASFFGQDLGAVPPTVKSVPAAAPVGARRSGRRPSSSTAVITATLPVDGTASSSGKLATPSAKTGIVYPATPSTVASSDDSHSIASGRIASFRGGVSAATSLFGGTAVQTLTSSPRTLTHSPAAEAVTSAPSRSFDNALPSPSPSPTDSSLARALHRHSNRRRASTSSANCDSQSVRSSLSRLHRNHQNQQAQIQQKQQRRMSSSSALGAKASASLTLSVSSKFPSEGANAGAAVPTSGRSAVQW